MFNTQDHAAKSDTVSIIINGELVEVEVNKSTLNKFKAAAYDEGLTLGEVITNYINSILNDPVKRQQALDMLEVEHAAH